MSSSDPNDPYRLPDAADQPPRQDGLPTYPQQGQQPGGHPAYPGPAQGPYAGPGGPDGPATAMPGKAGATRILMYIVGGLQAPLSLLMIITTAAAPDEAEETFSDALGFEVTASFIYIAFGIYLIHAVIGIALAVMLGKGGTGVRVGGIVWAGFTALFGLLAIPIGVLWIAAGVLCIVFLANGEVGAWFKRHQYGVG